MNKPAHDIDAIKKACKVLFGEENIAHGDPLERLDRESIQAAYRIRAKESHPDRAALVSLPPEELEEKFLQVDSAYRMLLEAVDKRLQQSSGPVINDVTLRRTRKATARTMEVPPVELQLGQYLFYRGKITIPQLLEALNWQRSSRPPLGALAADMGFIQRKDLLAIIRKKEPSEKFGSAAVRLGYLNSFQLRNILQEQQEIQPGLGSFFARNQILSEHELAGLVDDLNSHNARVREKIRTA